MSKRVEWSDVEVLPHEGGNSVSGCHVVDRRSLIVDRLQVDRLQVDRLSRVGLLFFVWISGLGWAQSPPVLLIHGLTDDACCWQELAGNLTRNGWDEGCLIRFASQDLTPRRDIARCGGGNITSSATWNPSCLEALRSGRRIFFRVQFDDNADQSFEMQGRQVGAAVRLVRQWTGASSVVLVGHSMGGLAARAYLQLPVYGGDVCGLVTVSTPHLGSLLPYYELTDLGSCPNALKKVMSKGRAVSLLAPDSQEMTAINRPSWPYGPLPGDLSVFNIIANHPRTAGSSGCFALLSQRYDCLARWQEDLSRHFQSSVSFASAGVMANWSDGVVPCLSQYLKASPVGQSLDIQWTVVEANHASVLGFVIEMATAIEAVSCEVTAGNDGNVAAPTSKSLDVVLIIDSSGSMGQNDPHDLRKKAASYFVQLFEPGDLGTVVDFDGSATVRVNGSGDPGALRRGIDQIDADGRTHIGKGVAAAYSALVSRPHDAVKGAILLTDGEGEYRDEAAQFQAKGWPIYTIGLTGEVNERLLSRIAAQTGGRYFKAESAGDLQKLFGVIHAGFRHSDLVSLIKGTIQMGQLLEETFVLDSSISRALVSLYWPGSDLDMRLVDPGGSVHVPGVREGSYEYLEIKNPIPGEWRLGIEAVQVSTGGEPFEALVTADSTLNVDVSGLDRAYRPGEALSIRVGLPGVNGITGSMRVKSPQGSRKTVQGAAETGAVRFTFNETRTPGDYDVEFVVRGSNSRGESVARAVMQTVHVSGAPYEAGLGKVVRVEGAYVTVDMGRDVGIRHGLKMFVYSDQAARSVCAEGMVVEVMPRSCTMELITVGAKEPKPGMAVKPDPLDWHRD